MDAKKDYSHVISGYRNELRFPLSSEMPVPVRSSSRIELTFPNGVLLSADQYPPQDLLVLLNGYRGGRV